MSYYDVALLADDADFLSRVTACVAVENEAHGLGLEPDLFTASRRWRFAAMPGFGDAYSSALVAEVASPGKDQGVITDGMILAAVQALMNEGA